MTPHFPQFSRDGNNLKVKKDKGRIERDRTDIVGYEYRLCYYDHISRDRQKAWIVSRGGNRAGRVGLGRANSGPSQNRAGPKLARFFRTKILTAQPVLKTVPIGLNSLFKAKKIRPGRAGPNLARFFSGQ